MQLKRWFSLLLAAAILISGNSLSFASIDTDVLYAASHDISTTASAVEAVVSEVYAKGVINDWYVPDMAADGCISEEMRSYVENIDDEIRLVTDAERILIMKSAVGIRDEELVDYICENIKGMSINQLIFGLLALDSYGYDRPLARQQLIDGILASQNELGGFGAAAVIDTDNTSLAILALSPYEQCTEAVEKGIEALAQMQGESGAFCNRYGVENSNSTSVAINALCGAGVDIFTDSRFIKSGNSLEGLLTFMNEDYTFGFTNTRHNSLSTEQAFRAMVSVKRQLNGENKVYIFRFGGGSIDLPSTESTTAAIESTTESTSFAAEESTAESTTEISTSAQITITETTSAKPTAETAASTETTTEAVSNRPGGGGGSSTKRISISVTVSTLEEPCYAFDFTDTVSVYAGSSAWTAVKAALDNQGLTYAATGDEESIYISAIGEDSSHLLYEFDMGVNSGWKYSINGREPEASMGSIKLSDGDIIQLYYVTDYTKESSDSSYNDQITSMQKKFDPVTAFTDLTRKRLAVIITYAQGTKKK